MRDLFCGICFALCCGVSGVALVLALRAMEANAQQALKAMNAEPEKEAPEPGLALLFLQGLALCVLFIGFLILAFGYQANAEHPTHNIERRELRTENS